MRDNSKIHDRLEFIHDRAAQLHALASGFMQAGFPELGIKLSVMANGFIGDAEAIEREVIQLCVDLEQERLGLRSDGEGATETTDQQQEEN